MGKKKEGPTVKSRLTTTGLWMLMLVVLSTAGCNNGFWTPGTESWFDPSAVIKRNDTINAVYESIGVTDKSEEIYPNATQPTYEDLLPSNEDYVMGPTDILRISIMDLFAEGLETNLERQVSNSGFIDLPQIPNVKAGGRTQDQLIAAIKQSYQKAGILNNPVVSVLVAVPRQNVVSVLGAVQRPGTYPIPRKDFTLLEALAMVSDVSQPGIEWIYVIRPAEKGVLPPGVTSMPCGVGPGKTGPKTPEQQMQELEQYLPGGKTPTTGPGSREDQLRELEKFIPGASRLPKGRQDGADQRILLSETGAPATGPTSNGAKPTTSAAGEVSEAGVIYKWIYSDGQWIRVPQSTTTAPSAAPAATAGMPKDPFGWKQYDLSHMSRVIAINLPQLRYNPRLNIIVRDNDIVQIPFLEQGEFYVMGQVQRPGVYSLTGRRVTVKMALAAAGNLDPLSWPNNSVLIRRIDRSQEQYIPLNLQEIVNGCQSDYILKPNDVIAVGSYWATPFLAVWRNAFRMTYGFGFIYDRNFNNRQGF